MGNGHDKIIHSIDNEKIYELFCPKFFSEKGIWVTDTIHKIVKNGIKSISIPELNSFCNK